MTEFIYDELGEMWNDEGIRRRLTNRMRALESPIRAGTPVRTGLLSRSIGTRAFPGRKRPGQSSLRIDVGFNATRKRNNVPRYSNMLGVEAGNSRQSAQWPVRNAFRAARPALRRAVEREINNAILRLNRELSNNRIR